MKVNYETVLMPDLLTLRQYLERLYNPVPRRLTINEKQYHTIWEGNLLNRLMKQVLETSARSRNRYISTKDQTCVKEEAGGHWKFDRFGFKPARFTDAWKPLLIRILIFELDILLSDKNINAPARRCGPFQSFTVCVRERDCR